MSGNRIEIFFFLSSLPSLVSVSPHPSVSFSLASSVLTPRYAAAALTGPPGRGGGSRAQSRGYPPACEGRWGYVTSGAGPRAVGTERGRVELMIMSDTCATHRSRVPRGGSGRIKGGATTVEDERGPGLDFNLCFVCGSRPLRGCRFTFVFVDLFIKLL